MGTILEVSGVSKNFNGVQALTNLDLSVAEGEIRAIIGPNGSGKTTLINVITGIYPASAGRIIFDGEDITNLPSYHRVRRGMARTFQNLRLFPTMSVIDHILAAQYIHAKVGLFGAIFPTTEGSLEEAKMYERAMEILRFVDLADRAAMPAVSLPYGQRRVLEIARALAASPKIVFLDEPAAGLSADEINSLEKLLRRIQELGITICLVEHRMMLVMSVAEKITVLNYGEKIAEGPPEKIKDNHEVIEAYLGRELASELDKSGE
ncbi:MAG: ABC transporter ATP-binding protein [Limnochordia bacterium]